MAFSTAVLEIDTSRASIMENAIRQRAPVVKEFNVPGSMDKFQPRVRNYGTGDRPV